jgi:hypothetical protein
MQKPLLSSRFGRFVSWVQVASLVAAMIVPAILVTTRVDALQVEQRSIDISTSEAAATGVDYTISFDVPDTGTENIGGFAVEFCDSDPLPGETCTYDAVGDDVPNLVSASLQGTPTFDGVTIQDTGETAETYDFALASTTDIAADTTFTVTLNNVINPSNSTDGDDNNTFYARLYVYSDTGLTTEIHNGGVALSTAAQLIVTARVQERLEFCVGEADSNGSGNCSDLTGTSIDLGVLTPAAANYASVNPTGDTDSGHVRLSTNAFNGATIQYYATELQVSGATCSGTDFTDQCINEKGTAAATITTAAGTEEWGMEVNAVTDDGTVGGQELTVAANYDNQYHIVTEASTLLASSTSIVDNEQLDLDFGATPHTTTPTGVYESTVTFVATGTF